MFCGLAFALIAAALQLAAVSPAQAYTGTVAELEGTWNFNTLSSGTDNTWGRGTITIQADGTYAAVGTDINGNTDDFNGTLSITSDVLTMSGAGSGNTQCQVDNGVSLLVCTQTETDSSTTLIVATKQASSCAQTDLAGTWQYNRLSSGSKNQWLRSTVTIKNSGAFSEAQLNSDGTKKTKTGTFSISSDCTITVTSDDFSDSNRQEVLDSGKTLMAVTSTKSDGVTAQLGVMAKKASSYSAADLPGTWEMNSLDSGADAPRWKRGVVTVDSSGNFTLSGTESNSNTLSSSGKLSISSAGVVTCSSCETDFKGVMDSGKTSLVITNTPDTGAYEMGILTRNPLTISGTVATSGGTAMSGVTVTLASSSGTVLSSVTTDSSGAYSFGSLLNGKYTVKPSYTGYALSPKSQSVTLKGSNATQNFTGTAVTISGKVTAYTGKGTLGSLGGDDITIDLSGTATSSAVTDTSGNFAFSELANGVYTVTPVAPVVTSQANHPTLSFVPSKFKISITGKSSASHTFKYKSSSSCTKCH